MPTPNPPITPTPIRTEPSEPKEKQSESGIFIGHGIQDLPLSEQEYYRDKTRKVVIQVPPKREIEQQFVRVEGPDYLSQGFFEALRREAENNPHLEPLVSNVISMAKHIAKSKQTGERIGVIPKSEATAVVTEAI